MHEQQKLPLVSATLAVVKRRRWPPPVIQRALERAYTRARASRRHSARRTSCRRGELVLNTRVGRAILQRDAPSSRDASPAAASPGRSTQPPKRTRAHTARPDALTAEKCGLRRLPIKCTRATAGRLRSRLFRLGHARRSSSSGATLESARREKRARTDPSPLNPLRRGRSRRHPPPLAAAEAPARARARVPLVGASLGQTSD